MSSIEREEITVVRKILEQKLIHNDINIATKIIEFMDIDIFECEMCEKSVIYPTDREEDVCDSCWDKCRDCSKCDNKVIETEYCEKYECEYCDYIIHQWCKGNYEDICFITGSEVCSECVDRALSFWDNRER